MRGSNPFDLALIGNRLYVRDGGRNLVWEADIHSGEFTPLATFDPIPNPMSRCSAACRSRQRPRWFYVTEVVTGRLVVVR